MKIGQYCQRQRCRHVELEQFWQAFASRGFVSDSWAFLLALVRTYASLKIVSTALCGELSHRATRHHLLYGITLVTRHNWTHPILTPASWYSVYLSWSDARLVWSWTYRDGLSTHRWSPIQVLTGSDVYQLRWSRPMCYY